jgi:hypothetical protein
MLTARGLMMAQAALFASGCGTALALALPV